MCNIKYVFLDVDDTLLDFDLCGSASLRDGLKSIGCTYNDDMFPVFKKINAGFWSRIEKGEITRDYLDEHRFREVFAALHIDADGRAFEKIFHDNLAASKEKVEGADETLAYLHDKYKLFIASNGHAAQQKNRLKSCGLLKYIDEVFVSEEIGYAKPAREFFDYAVNKIGITDRREAIVIGDSLSADISGGINSGFTTCWFNKNKINVKEIGDVKPDYIITRLLDVKNIL